MNIENSQPIRAIYGPEPGRPGEYPTCYMMDKNAGAQGEGLIVSRIAYREENYGDHGVGWFDVFVGDHRFASMSARHVAEVHYLEEGA